MRRRLSLPPAAAFVAGLATTIVLAPLLVWAAFSAHEPRCEDGGVFWNGDLPTGDGAVSGVILGSSSMGLDVDVYALAAATGAPWQRVARHAIEQASIPASYPRMLASSDARPGMDALVVEVSPSLFDTTGCARPPLDGVAMEPGWALAAREMLGEDAALAPALAMELLPHRWIMTSGRRSDLVSHLKRPAHALKLVTDLPGLLEGRKPPARWRGEPAPDITPERAWKRRAFLLGAPIERFEPTVSAACTATLSRVIAAADARRTVLVLPPLRATLQQTFPAGYLDAVRASATQLAAASPRTRVLDAIDRFTADESTNFLDFDHLNATGAAAFTADLARALDAP